MILETFKISVNDLKITCSTTIYKNLLLIMRIENRQYTIIPSTGYFDGASTIKSRSIDTIDFQFDTERNKYLPKQIQLELKLIYRTGKINQKVYPISLNEFSAIRKGVKSKILQIFQRLYSLQCTFLAKSNGTDSPFFNQQPSNLQRVKSEKRFQKQSSVLQDSNKRRFYNSKSPDPVIKYTIDENIKITRHEQPIQNSLYSQKSIHQEVEKHILKQSFELNNQSSHFQERIQQSRPRIAKSIQSHHYPIQAINKISIDKNKILAFENTIDDLKKQLQKEKQLSYQIQKDNSSLKNKIQHLYHEKNFLVKEKQEDRFVFQTRDKEQKIRQRKDIDSLKRQYQGLLSQKQKQLNAVSLELKQTYNTSIANLNKANECQYKVEQISNFLQKQIQDLQSEVKRKNDEIYHKNQELNNQISKQNLRRIQSRRIQMQSKLLQEKVDALQNQLQQTNLKYQEYVKNSDIYIKQTRQQISQEFTNKSHNEDYDREDQQLYQLVNKQTNTYHQMIAKLQENMRKLEKSLQNIQSSHMQNSQQLERKNLLLHQNSFDISKLEKKIKYLENELIFERTKIAELKSLLTDAHSSESLLRDKIQKEKKHIHHRSYSLTENPVRETVKIKTTERYRLIYEPQTSIVYVPPLKYVTLEQKIKPQQYGKNYEEYNNFSRDAKKLYSSNHINSPYINYHNGYFGNALTFNTINEIERSVKDKIQKEMQNSSQQIRKQKRQNSSNDLGRKSKSKNFKSSIRNNYLEDSLFDRNDEDCVVQNYEGSYIDQNGDYVKEKRKTTYKKN